jgi:HEAT repeat protein
MVQTRSRVAWFVLAILGCAASLAAQDLTSLLSRFQAEQDRTARELILEDIVEHHPDAGPALLKIAKNPNPEDPDLEWLATRGIGRLKYKDAAPFLKQCLTSKSNYVRANAAEALRDLQDSSAIPDLIRMLEIESDSGVIEQTSLALLMLDARETVPVLKEKATNPSFQTRCWVLDAIARLGSKADVPFLAGFLSDGNQFVGARAALGIQSLTGHDFDFPKCADNGPCGFGYGIENAQAWWRAHKNEYQDR